MESSRIIHVFMAIAMAIVAVILVTQTAKTATAIVSPPQQQQQVALPGLAGREVYYMTVEGTVTIG